MCVFAWVVTNLDKIQTWSKQVLNRISFTGIKVQLVVRTIEITPRPSFTLSDVSCIEWLCVYVSKIWIHSSQIDTAHKHATLHLWNRGFACDPQRSTWLYKCAGVNVFIKPVQWFALKESVVSRFNHDFLLRGCAVHSGRRPSSTFSAQLAQQQRCWLVIYWKWWNYSGYLLSNKVINGITVANLIVLS